jgi:hypothetical protein
VYERLGRKKGGTVSAGYYIFSRKKKENHQLLTATSGEYFRE